ncbi:winged helix-turn-helix domain-containing protein [Microbispora bryophytorum]|uniref:winged helix-turn-helix domain-containing protein n=1 Tax=Microbispora bryophytorum TaxID=1460882 RepID=UPI0033F18B6E
MADGLLRIDVAAHRVWVGGVPVRVSRMRFRVLVFLAHHAGEAVTREQLFEYAWGDEWYPRASRTIDQHICHIRRLLGSAAECIAGVRGIGYRLEAEALADPVTAPPATPTIHGLAETLRDTVAGLDGHIERRAQQIADPLIEEARRAADERVAAAERELANVRQRGEDLAAEFRRQLVALERQLDRRKGTPDAPAHPAGEVTHA